MLLYVCCLDLCVSIMHYIELITYSMKVLLSISFPHQEDNLIVGFWSTRQWQFLNGICLCRCYYWESTISQILEDEVGIQGMKQYIITDSQKINCILSIIIEGYCRQAHTHSCPLFEILAQNIDDFEIGHIVH